MIDHFAYGALTPLLSFLLSCAGCGVGLSCTARARVASGSARATWLLLGAVAIGGTGTWVMHFVAMLGFAITGVRIHYDVFLTVVSMLVAIVVVAVGLFGVHNRRGSTTALVVGGVVAGLGVAAMHYLGMAAMHVNVDIDYDPLLVALSVAVAVVAATTGLWLSTRVRGFGSGAAATVTTGLAVSGMHYTGMAALRVARYEAGAAIQPPAIGLPAAQLLVPLVIGIVASTVALLIVAGAWPSASEMEVQAEFDAWAARQRRQQEEQQRDDGGGSPLPGRSGPP